MKEPLKRGRPKGSTLSMRYPEIQRNDAESSERNVCALKREMEKEKPRKEAVLSWLREIFSMRREILFSGNLTIADILLTHKVLTLPHAVSLKKGSCVLFHDFQA